MRRLPHATGDTTLRRRVVNGCYRPRRRRPGPFVAMLWIVAAYVAAGLVAQQVIRFLASV